LDLSSDVCSSDLPYYVRDYLGSADYRYLDALGYFRWRLPIRLDAGPFLHPSRSDSAGHYLGLDRSSRSARMVPEAHPVPWTWSRREQRCRRPRSEEHTSELQSRFDLVCR